MTQDYPFIRELRSPVTDDQLRPLDPVCQVVQFCDPLSAEDHRRVAKFMSQNSRVPLRAYGHYSNAVPDLSFLEHYPQLTRFSVDIVQLGSLRGIEQLPPKLQSLGLGQTRTKTISLSVISRFSDLKELFVEGHHKDLEAVSSLQSLEKLTLKAITLPDLSLLLPLRRLWWLDLKLGGITDLSLLPQVGRLKYLELVMIKGLFDLSAIGRLASLQCLVLSTLKNVAALPSFKGLDDLRRVTLITMKGLKSIGAVADAPALEELQVVGGSALSPKDFAPLVGHPTLMRVSIGLGRDRQNREVTALLGLPPCEFGEGGFSFR